MFLIETEKWKSGSQSSAVHFPSVIEGSPSAMDDSRESTQYTPLRIIGKIQDDLSFPPSLLLKRVSIFTVSVSFDNLTGRVINIDERKEYGLVLSQITYYEPIHDIALFLRDDSRVKYKISKRKRN